MKWITLFFLLTYFFISFNSFASPLPNFRYAFTYDYENMGYFELTGNFNHDVKRESVFGDHNFFCASSIPKPPLILFFVSGLIGFYLAGQKFRK
jgi:hypothetical protein